MVHHEDFMEEALRLASKGELEVLPNPSRLGDCCTVAPDSEGVNNEDKDPNSPQGLNSEASRVVKLIQEVFPGTEVESIGLS